ncbi:MAG: hypothetical protein ACYTHM_15520 [Planctomycetota bacterium]|jgi:rubrerythrin
MNLEEAIQTAIDFERKVVKTYRDAEKEAADPKGKRIFRVLAKEEEDHVAYLESRLAEWKETGKVTAERLDTIVPPKEAIEAGVRKLETSLAGKPSKAEIEFLQRALKAETEASRFYGEVVSQLGDEGRELFTRFVEIEEGHLAIVQAEIDSVSRSGVWFDFQEFQL